MSQSKKRKLEETEKDPVVYFDPQRIPIEIWNETFKHSSTKDLLNLSLVCKTFYKTIGDLPKAMDKIKLKLNKKTLKDVELILSSSRIFSNIKIMFPEKHETSKQQLEDCKKILTKFEGNIRTLEIINEEKFYEFLEIAQKSLKSLTFISTILYKNEFIAPRSFKLSMLQRLHLNFHHRRFSSSGGEFINFLEESFLPDTLLNVVLDFENVRFHPKFSKLLASQKNLIHLSLGRFKTESALNDILGAQINFKLQKLEIVFDYETSFCQFIMTDTMKLENFLKSQTDSLKELSITSFLLSPFSALFENMPNLQLLEINNMNYGKERFVDGPYFNCPSLKKIILNIRVDDLKYSYVNLLKRFPNIQEIHMLFWKTDCRMIKAIAKNHPNLKKLVLEEIKKNSFETVSFKNLTTFEITRYKNENLKSLILAMENLEILKLGLYVLVTESSLLFILDNLKKLKQLEINNGFKLTDDLLCRHLDFFKNLKFLKIFRLPGPVENFIAGLSQFPYLKHSLSIKPVRSNPY